MITEFKKKQLRKKATLQDIYRIIAVIAFMAGLVAFTIAFSSYNDTLILLYY